MCTIIIIIKHTDQSEAEQARTLKVAGNSSYAVRTLKTERKRKKEEIYKEDRDEGGRR